MLVIGSKATRPERFGLVSRVSPPSIQPALRLCLLGIALLLVAVVTVFAIDWTCPYCHQTFHFDPRDGAYMENWKQLHLNQVHGGNKSANAPSPYGGVNPFDGVFQPIGQALAKALFGDPQQRALDEARVRQRREQLAAATRLEQERQARDAQLAAEERQRQFAEDKARILGQMRGFDGRAFDGASTQTAELRVKETDDIFGTKTVKPADSGVTVGGMELKSIDFKPNVPPAGPEKETAESKAERERVRQQILAYQTLVDRGRKQLEDFRAGAQLVQGAETQLAAARKAEVEARQAKAALESPPPGSAPPAAGAVEDALAALAKAEQASADADRALADAKNRQAGIEKQMQETLQTLAQTPRPPDWVDQPPVAPQPPTVVPPDR